MRGRPTNGEEDVAEGVQQVQLVTMERRIKRLEREWDHPARPAPDPETVAEYARLWIDAGLEESRAMARPWSFWNTARPQGRRRPSWS